MSMLDSDRISPLTLGTASLGMAYGVANWRGQPDDTATKEILSVAWSRGINCLDTAPTYGAAERLIGGWAEKTGNRPFLVTKLPPVGDAPDPDAAIRRAMDLSRRSLAPCHVGGYLAHDANDFFDPDIRRLLLSLRDKGEVDAIGLSVYTPDEARWALKHELPDIIQVPMNLFDARMAHSGVLDACHAAGVKVFARSVFLQGALLMPVEKLPSHLAPLSKPLSRIRDIAAEAGIAMNRLLLGAVQQHPQVTSIVIGVQNVTELRQTLDAASEPAPVSAVTEAAALAGGEVPLDCLDPRSWPA